MIGEFKNAFQNQNNAHIRLILINAVIFLFLAVVMVITTIGGFDGIFIQLYKQFSIPPSFADFSERPWTLITYAFSHQITDIWHIIFNMLSLYWFGRLFIEYLGNDRLIALYVLGALAGGLFYLLMFNTIPFFIERSGSGMVGASAAVYAIMVGSATLVPDYTFFLMFFGPVRIKYIALFFILLSFIGTVSSNAGGNLAHLGGALVGFVYVKQLQRGTDLGGWITALINRVTKLFKRRPTMKFSRTERPKKSAVKDSAISQQEIDAILDKISEKGYDALTREEKEKLFRAGKN